MGAGRIAFSGLALAASTAAAPPAALTWAKPGVSLEDYRRDGGNCAAVTDRTPVAIRPGTLRQLGALSSAQMVSMFEGSDYVPAGGGVLGYFSAWDSYRSETDIARRSYNFGAQYVHVVRGDVKEELQGAVDDCLRGRGYVQVRLTPAQMRRLARLKRGSDARRAFLHDIAADPSVAADQRVAPAGRAGPEATARW